jgi:hypothetical protein
MLVHTLLRVDSWIKEGTVVDKQGSAGLFVIAVIWKSWERGVSLIVS